MTISGTLMRTSAGRVPWQFQACQRLGEKVIVYNFDQAAA